MRKYSIWLMFLSVFVTATASAFSFPEIGFCPLGGPPGWFNRMTGQHHKRYYAPPPVVFMPPPTAGRPVYPASPVAPYYVPPAPLYRR